jgi:hypothetical protein
MTRTGRDAVETTLLWSIAILLVAVPLASMLYRRRTTN